MSSDPRKQPSAPSGTGWQTRTSPAWSPGQQPWTRQRPTGSPPRPNAAVLTTGDGGAAQDVNGNGAHTTIVQAAVIRDATMGIIPQSQNIQRRVPFNLMKSEQLIWVIQGVDYLETVTRRECRGSSQGVGIRVAKGLYYSPRQFRSRAVEWEETVKADTGILGLTTKHLYFSGSRKKFRVRYDQIVSFDPYEDGLGIMRDTQTAKPQSFGTGDGWFVYNLTTNLAQM